MRRAHAIVIQVVAATAMVFVVKCGYADVVVEGSPDHVVITADHAQLSDVIEALSKKFDVHLKSSVQLDSQTDGQFSGTLTYVLKRLLRSYDFALTTARVGRIEPPAIVIYGQRNDVKSRLSPVIRRPADGRSNVSPREEGGN
jgi:hypothetical protein